jgi:hypothetical protein
MSLLVAAVDVARGREDDVPDAEFVGGPEDVLGPVAVDGERLVAAVVGRVRARDGREMDDRVGPPHRRLDVAVLPDVPPSEPDGSIAKRPHQRPRRTGRE